MDTHFLLLLLLTWTCIGSSSVGRAEPTGSSRTDSDWGHREKEEKKTNDDDASQKRC